MCFRINRVYIKRGNDINDVLLMVNWANDEWQRNFLSGFDKFKQFVCTKFLITNMTAIILAIINTFILATHG